MQRIDAFKILNKHRRDEPVILGVGYQVGEYYSLGHNDLNLPLVNLPYPAPLGLGLALALPGQKIIVSEGDGSAVSGLSSFCTIGNIRPKNFIHIIWDNESWMAPGQVPGGHLGPLPTATAGHTDLIKVAKGVGIESTHCVSELDAFETALKIALETDGPHLIVAKVETSTIGDLPPVPYGITESAIRFRRALIDKGWVNPLHAGATVWKNADFNFGKVDSESAIDVTYQALKGMGAERPPRLSADYARTIYTSIRAAGVDMAVYLPDSANYMIQRFAFDDPKMLSVSVTREDEGMAIAMGGFLGGRTPCLIMEASGYGLCYLALAWLGIQQRMATLIISSHTDGLGEHTDYHVCTRYVAEPLLRAMGIPHYTLMDIKDAPRLIKQATMTVRGHVFPVAIQLPRHVLWEDPS
jgi:sulfopyruvate decarboxylase TPP-binding subunit